MTQPTTGFERVTAFHEAFGLPVNGPGYVPTVEERLLRGRLLLEEVLEHLVKGLGLKLVAGREQFGAAELDQVYLLADGDAEYDPVETLDGLCDVKVIANGTGVAFGLPVEAGDRLVYESNMAKLGPNGKPIVNGVTPGYRDPLHTHVAADSAGHRPDLPHGKVLKPEGWSPPDMAGLVNGRK